MRQKANSLFIQCCICNDDGSLRCHGCEDDVFCQRCFKEQHKGWLHKAHANFGSDNFAQFDFLEKLTNIDFLLRFSRFPEFQEQKISARNFNTVTLRVCFISMARTKRLTSALSQPRSVLRHYGSQIFPHLRETRTRQPRIHSSFFFQDQRL